MTNDEKISINKYDLLYEQRMTRVETAMETLSSVTSEMASEIKEIRRDMKTDFRWLFGLILIVAGLMAKGFHWIGG